MGSIIWIFVHSVLSCRYRIEVGKNMQKLIMALFGLAVILASCPHTEAKPNVDVKEDIAVTGSQVRCQMEGGGCIHPILVCCRGFKCNAQKECVKERQNTEAKPYVPLVHVKVHINVTGSPDSPITGDDCNDIGYPCKSTDDCCSGLTCQFITGDKRCEEPRVSVGQNFQKKEDVLK